MSTHRAVIDTDCLDLTLSLADTPAVEKIVERARDRWRFLSVEQIEADLLVCHKHLIPLRLADLAEADILDLAHDIHGLRENLSVVVADGGKLVIELAGCFVPRFAVQKEAVSN